MENYLITFTPLEPYFFGGEKVFAYGKDNSHIYYIQSEELPFQTTIFGTLRYCCIENPSNDFRYNPGIIGKKSFQLSSTIKQDFGCIKGISPIFLVCGNEYFIKTPFNHQVSDKGGGKSLFYSPFCNYQSVKTCEGEKIFPIDYVAKEGVADSFLNISTGKIEHLIRTTEQVGINTNKRENGFFKKRFAYLNQDTAFAVMAKIEGVDMAGKEMLVYMGQGKSAFTVRFQQKEDDFTGRTKDFLRRKNQSHMELVIALSDIYLREAVSRLNSCCYWVNSDLRDYREFRTNYAAKSFNGRFQKSENLQHLIKAGSVFLVKPEEREEFIKMIEDENCRQAGFNWVVSADTEMI